VRLIDADALLKHQQESDKIRGVILVVSKGYILDAPTIKLARPDPESGLVPCGCGGVPIYDSYAEEWQVKCTNLCPASTFYKETKEEAAAEWNRMMGH
jgi:hypothetical protein